MKTLILAAMMAASITAAAGSGHEVGNGGGVIYCENKSSSMPAPPSKITVELLDLYEARVLRNLKLGLGDPAEDYHVKIERTLSKFARIAPFRTQKYRKLYESFFNESVIIPDADLVFIPDAGNLLLPKGCQLKQVAIQKVPEFPGDNRYFISKEYWDLMDNNSKAALILHEIIYHEGIFLGHTDSRAVRYLNSYITSTKLDELTQEQMAFMLFKANFDVADLMGTLARVIQYENSTVELISTTATYTGVTYNNFFADIDLPAEITYDHFKLNNKFMIWAFGGKLRGLSGVTKVDLPNLKISQKSDDFLNSTEGFNLQFSEGKVADFSISLNQALFYPAQFTVLTNGIEISLKTIRKDADFVAGMSFDPHNQSPYYYFGEIVSKNPAIGYVSPKLSFSDQMTGNIKSDGVVLEGYLSEAATLPTNQGTFDFIPGLMLPSKELFKFYGNGLVDCGILKPGQTVKTFQGYVTTTEAMRVYFLEDGIARLESLNSDTAPAP